MTLEQANADLLAAIAAEDLGGIAAALTRRAEAMEGLRARSAQPSPESLRDGQRAIEAMEALKQRWALESSRLGQIQAGFGQGRFAGPAFHDFVG